MRKKVYLAVFSDETELIEVKSLAVFGLFPKAYFPGLILKPLENWVPYLERWS
jgi:hypothetical protein